MQLDEPGDAEQFRRVELRLPPPAAGEVRLRHTAIAVNFLDIYHRKGLYPLPAWPAVLGVEAAGVVEVLGDGVTTLQPGQRVAYAGLPAGAYASARNLRAGRLVAIPDELGDEQVAATLMRGITAQMLFTAVRPTGAGDTVLVHAAAGGLGQVLGQWGRALGAGMIGTAGSAEKQRLALGKGYEQVLPYRDVDFVEAVRSLSGGRGVDYAIDGIGGETLRQTLRAVRPFGVVASVGQAGGIPDSLPLTELGPARSISLSRPGVMTYLGLAGRFRPAAVEVMERMRQGLRVDVSLRLPLRDVAEAHRRVEGGSTAGGVIVHP